MLAKRGLALTLNDEIVQLGTRIYVKATATLYGEMDKSFKVEAYAREPEEKKGMDESQITGTASSYARKYALNGLFAIDDTEDSDSNKITTIVPKRDPLSIDPDFGIAIVPQAGKPVPCTNGNIGVETLAEAKALRISLDKVATYLKKRPEEVTEEDRQKCIATKKKALGAKKL